jgi:outer membrane murein-binding lipoprotein Lpp
MTPEKENENMETMVSGFAAFQSYIVGLDSTANYLLNKFADLDAKFDDLDNKVDDFELDNISDKIDTLDSKVDDLDHMNSEVEECKDNVDNLDTKVDDLASKVDVLADKVDDIEVMVSDKVGDYFSYNFALQDHIDTNELVEAASDCIEATINSAIGRATTPALMADAVSTAVRSDPSILDAFFKTYAGQSLLIDTLVSICMNKYEARNDNR